MPVWLELEFQVLVLVPRLVLVFQLVQLSEAVNERFRLEINVDLN